MGTFLKSFDSVCVKINHICKMMNNCGRAGSTVTEKLMRLPLPSNVVLAFVVQLAKGRARFVELRTFTAPLGRPLVALMDMMPPLNPLILMPLMPGCGTVIRRVPSTVSLLVSQI